jgi:quercetin dioxygenase-like cupin family protein
MKVLRSSKALVLTSVLAGFVAVAATSIALAASVQTADTNNVRLRMVKSEFDDGFTANWHTHPGPVIVQVEEGHFKIYQGSCTPTIVGPGETFIEVPDVPVKAEAKGRIKWTTSMVLPGLAGSPGNPPHTTFVDDPCS